ncbi:hypothetical protein PAMA_009837 [Pampus argenteus]
MLAGMAVTGGAYQPPSLITTDPVGAANKQAEQSNKLLRDTAIWASYVRYMNTDTLSIMQENRVHPGMKNLQGLQPFLPRLELSCRAVSGKVKESVKHIMMANDDMMDTGAVRASSIFPILSVILLFMGGLCIAASEFYKSRHNIILSAGIFFVSAGLSNIIGIIVYISANAGDPSKSDSKKNSYSYGWSFYFGALSFIMAEMVGVLAVHMFIDRHRQLRIGARAADYLQGSAITRIPSYRYRYRRRSRSSSRSTDPSHSRDTSPVGLKGFSALPSTEISMYTLPRDTLKSSGTPTATYNSERDHNFLQVHNCIQKDLKDSSHTNTANRRTTPV